MAGSTGTPVTVGGYQWEAAEALKLAMKGNALGDATMTTLGWIRYSEALRNACQAGTAAEQMSILRAVESIRDARQTDAAHFEHVIGLLLVQADVEQATQAGQDVLIGLMDVRMATLEHVVALLVESAKKPIGDQSGR